jgi:hypothetical protein
VKQHRNPRTVRGKRNKTAGVQTQWPPEKFHGNSAGRDKGNGMGSAEEQESFRENDCTAGSSTAMVTAAPIVKEGRQTARESRQPAVQKRFADTIAEEEYTTLQVDNPQRFKSIQEVAWGRELKENGSFR